MNGSLNPVVGAILRSPAHRLLSGRLILLEITAESSGRRFTLPVAYQRPEPSRLVVHVGAPTRKRWWRNLRQPSPVAVWLRGERRTAIGTALEDEAGVGVSLELAAR